MGWSFKLSTGRAFAGLFGRRESLDSIKPGTTFRRVHDDRMEETAKVLAVGKDAYGIPHVRFHVSFRRPNRIFDGGARMLALESFADRYNEEVEPSQPAL